MLVRQPDNSPSPTGSVVLEPAFTVTGTTRNGPYSEPIGSGVNTGAGTGTRPGGTITIRTGTLKLVDLGLDTFSLVSSLG